MNRKVLITGASAGIGRAFAEVFAEKGFDTILVARREDKLKQLAEDLSEKFDGEHYFLTADLGQSGSPEVLYEQVKERGWHIDALVNNAGSGHKKSFIELEWTEHQAYLNLMMISLTQLCHLFAKDMTRREYGRIINVASIAPYAPEFPGNLYNAVKSYVTHMSEALDLELKPQNVNCLALCPGFTYTEFHEVMGVKRAVDKIPKWLWMDAKTVAQQGFEAVMQGRPVYINGWVNKGLVTALSLLPKGVKYRMARKH